MKHIITWCVALIGILALCSVFADTEVVDGVTWSYSVSEGNATVEGASPVAGSVSIPSRLGGYTVTCVVPSAFSGCSGMTSVTIPNSVTNIGSSAFSGCSGLTSMTLPFVGSQRGNAGTGDSSFGYVFGTSPYTGATAVKQYHSSSGSYSTFYIPSSLKTVVITDETKIGYGAFYNCSELTSVTITEGVTTIGGSAFKGCNAVEMVTIPSSVTSIGGSAFSDTKLWNDHSDGLVIIDNCLVGYKGVCSGSVEISDGVRVVADSIFSGCSGLTSVKIPVGVTSIGTYAFYGCSGLKSVTIPDGVTSIGLYAFSGCGGLTSVTIPEGVTNIGNNAFYNCSGLASVTIPSSVVSIGTSAFKGCEGLTSVTIQSSITSIGGGAFKGCSGLTSVTIPACVTKLSTTFPSAYSEIKEVVILDGMTSIENEAFNGCRGLTLVVIPSSVTSIGELAFCNCSGLTSITIPNSVTNIGSSAFGGCSGLTSMTLPFVGSQRGNAGTEDSLFGYIFGASSSTGAMAVKQCYSSGSYLIFYIPSSLKTVVITDETKIGYGAFYNCSELTSVTIPESVTAIEATAFYNCSGLTAVHISDLAAWCGIEFGSYSANPLCYAKHLYLNGEEIRDLTVPEEITSVGECAFYNCSGLESVTIPEYVTSIENEAFYGCSGLTSVTIRPSVTRIGDYAFCNCSGLESVTIPSSVTSIGEGAFKGCSGLTTVTVPASVTSIGVAAFGGCSGLTSMTLPFVGSQRGNTRTEDSLFGYIFGTSSSKGTTAVSQYDSSLYWKFYIPSSLKTVVITDETIIGYGAFYNCSWLESVTMPECVTSIGYNAFYNTKLLNDRPEGLVIVDNCLVKYKGTCTGEVVVPDGVRVVAGGAFYNCSGLTSVTIPSSLTGIGEVAFGWCSGLRSVTIPEGVRDIGDGAFEGCSGLMSVTIPSSVTSIGYHAFYGCNSLMSVTIPACVTELSATFPSTYTKIKEVIICDGVTSIGGSVFKYCSGLEAVRIPSSVTSIENCAFEGCGRLTSFVVDVANPEYCSLTGMLCSKDGKTLVAGVNGKVTIPSSVTSIGDYAFYKCSGLTSVVIPEGVESIGVYAFFGCSGLKSVTMPEGLTSIGVHAFAGCSGLTSVSIPSSVTTIGEWAFWGCNGLESVGIPSGVTSIGDRLFSGCSGLTSVSIPSGVKSIGKSAFSGCSGLKSVTIPESVTSIGDHAFSGCSGLTSMAIPSGVKSIEDYVISGCSGLTSVTIPEGVTNIGEYALSDCSGLMSVKIPSGVTSIGVHAFSGCGGLKSVAIPTSVTSIGKSAFSGCSGLKTMTIPESVSSIGGYAFSSCRGLTSVTIKSGVESIGEWAFWNCSELKSVTIPVSVTSVGNGAFSGCASLTSVNVASLAGWMVLSFGNAAANPLSTGAALYVGGEEVTDLEIPEGTMGIGDYAFVGGRFTSVTIPKSVTSINKQAFLDCDNLQTVYVETGDVERVREMMVWSDSGLDFGDIQFVEFEKPAPVVMSPIEYVNLNGATHDNPTSYQEGSSVEFTPPSILTGYHFTGWSPSAILPEMSGPQTVVANWSANSYQIVYLPNGGSGSMSAVDCVYDQEVVLAINGYSRSGYFFNGWATAASGEVIYRPGEKVSNLTAEDGGVVKLYAVWGKAGSQEILWPNWEKTETDCFVSVNDSVLRIDTTVEEGGRLSLYVEGPGTLTFLARGSDDGFYYCERGGRGNYVRNSGSFAEYTYEVKGDGPHTILWITYTKGYLGRDAWGEIKDVCWRGNPLKYGGSDPAPASPTVEGDEYAVVSGDAETGFVIKPSEGKTAVEVSIPQGVDAAKVTVEVSTKVATVKPNGAKVKVVVGEDDITGYLVIPENDGVMNIAAATVKEEIVKETLDPSKDAVIELNAANPRLTTALTRKGLTYTLFEGHKLESLSKGDSKLGDGNSWTPTITVLGGNAAFYSIDVAK